MSTLKGLLPIVLLATAGSAHAGQSLWCQLEAGTLVGTGKAAKVTDFVWSAAQDEEGVTGPIKTSLGVFDAGEGSSGSTALTLGGKAVALAPKATGIIGFGKVYDFGSSVAVAYVVERPSDSSATPSEAVVVIGKGGTVSKVAVLAGTQPRPAGHCDLY